MKQLDKIYPEIVAVLREEGGVIDDSKEGWEWVGREKADCVRQRMDVILPVANLSW